MKKTFVLLCTTMLIFSLSANAQFWKRAKKLLKDDKIALTEEDAAKGIREALIKGTSESVTIVSRLDGYYRNPEIKIPVPPEARTMEDKLRSIGMDKMVDDAIVSINRAAERAATEAKPIFVAAIKNMTISDAVNIVKGEKNAATKYLEVNTSPQLIETFQPIIKNALDEVDATKYWSEVITTYNKIPLVRKINPNLEEYVTKKAIEGLFIMIAKEELKIREDPLARTTEILKKVFGNL